MLNPTTQSFVAFIFFLVLHPDRCVPCYFLFPRGRFFIVECDDAAFAPSNIRTSSSFRVVVVVVGAAVVVVIVVVHHLSRDGDQRRQRCPTLKFHGSIFVFHGIEVKFHSPKVR